VKKVISNKQSDQAKAYMEHVRRSRRDDFETPQGQRPLHNAQAARSACERSISTTRHPWCVSAAARTMLPQYVRFIVEEVLEGRIGFYPTYGNTLMGLAASVPLRREDNFSITYYAPQPRAVFARGESEQTEDTVAYESWAVSS